MLPEPVANCCAPGWIVARTVEVGIRAGLCEALAATQPSGEHD